MNLDEQFKVAIEHFKQGNVEFAEKLCLENLENNPKHADSLNLAGAIHFKKGEIKEAIEQIQKAIDFNPQKAPIYSNNLTMGYALLGNLSAAVNILKNAAETFLGRGDKNEAMASFEKAAFMLRDAGQFEEAKKMYQRLIAIDERYMPAYNDLGLISQHEKNFDAAVTYFKKSLELAPDSPYTFNNLALTYKMMGKQDEALLLFEKALEIEPGLVEALINVANLYREQNNFKAAEENIRKALNLVPNHPGIHNNLGILLHAQGKLDEAIVCYSKALEIHPQFKEAEKNIQLAIEDAEKKSTTTLLFNPNN